jgi:hypothetical protein
MKIFKISKCSQCPKNISSDNLARAMGRYPELANKRICELASQFIGNSNIIQDYCPLSNEEETVSEINKVVASSNQSSCPAVHPRNALSRFTAPEAKISTTSP